MKVRVNSEGSDENGWDQVQLPSSGVELPTTQTGRSLRGYLLSLPERAIRSVTAMSAGLLREVGDAALPRQVRGTKLYQNMVEATLRFLIEQVGEVEGAYPAEGKLAEDFAVRRAAGNGIELAGILAFRASPVWVLAALADISGAGRSLILEIAESLKKEGLLEAEREFSTADQLLDGLQRTSGRLADAVNTPPLDVAGLRRELSALRAEAKRIPEALIPDPDQIWRQWEELKDTAAAEKRPVFQIASLMALSAIERVPANLLWLSRSAAVAARQTGESVGGVLLDHYSNTLTEIREVGFLAYWSEQFRPYLRGAAAQFSREKESWIEKQLGRGRTPKSP